MRGPVLPPDLERMLEAVGRTLLVCISGLLPLLTEQERLVVEEQVPLHGFEPGQVLHLEAERWSHTALSR